MPKKFCDNRLGSEQINLGYLHNFFRTKIENNNLPSLKNLDNIAGS